MAVSGVGNIRNYTDKITEVLLEDRANLLTLDLQQIEDFTFRLRQLKTVNYSGRLKNLKTEQCQKLARYYKKHSTQAIAEWSQTQPQYKDAPNKKKLASVYHRAPHGAEMRKDAELFLSQSNVQRLFLDPDQRALFCEMAAAAHAMHDVIQDKGPLKNEIESYLVFVNHTKEILDKAFKDKLITEEQQAQLFMGAKVFGWEIIVVGTIFDFKTKMPLIDILNKKTVAEEDQNDNAHLYPPQPDTAIACAAFAAGKNDTRRMEVVLDRYLQDPVLKKLIDDQFEATNANNNIFMMYMKASKKYTEKQLIAFRHMIGQNCRMICELKTHLARDNNDVEFAEFFANLISKASEQFDRVQWASLRTYFADLDDRTLTSYFSTLIGSFEGNFGEIAFAKGLNSDLLKESIENFGQLYPEHAFAMPQEGALWAMYADALEPFISDLKSKISATANDPKSNRKLMVQIFIDFALYGGHQIGNNLLQLDNDLAAEYEMVLDRIKQSTQKMFHRRLPSTATRLKLLADYQIEHKQEQPTAVDALAITLNKFKLDAVHQSLGREDFSPEQKHQAVHKLYRVTAERDTHRAQQVNAQDARNRKRTIESKNGTAAPSSSSSGTTPKSKGK